MRGIIELIPLREFPYRLPRADIGPAIGHWDNRCAIGALHYRIVDRFCVCARKGFALQRDEAEISRDAFHGCQNCARAFWLESFIFIKEHVSSKHEVSRIP